MTTYFDFLHVNLEGKSGKIWGAALLPTDGCKPGNAPIISIGHRITLETALDIVKNCCNFKNPEPIRIADKRSRAKLVEDYYSQVPQTKKSKKKKAKKVEIDEDGFTVC